MRVRLLVPALALLMAGIGCGNSVPGGAGLVFTTSGHADDGDDKNGAAMVYTDPMRNAADAGTDATSDPQTFRLLAGTVNVKPGR